jgi:hypothetical protein
VRDALIIVTFLIYTLIYEAIVWVGGMYVILNYSWSEWTVLVLMILSGAQLKPEHWRNLLHNEKPLHNEQTLPMGGKISTTNHQ